MSEEMLSGAGRESGVIGAAAYHIETHGPCSVALEVLLATRGGEQGEQYDPLAEPVPGRYPPVFMLGLVSGTCSNRATSCVARWVVRLEHR